MSLETPTLQRSALHAAHLRAGGKMIEFAGWELPVHYSGLSEEHRAVRRAAGMFDVSHMGEIRVGGRAAESFLQANTPNDVGRLRQGRAHYTGLMSERGSYLDDLLLYRLADDEFLLVVNAANAARALAALRQRAGEGVRVEDASGDYALLAVQGPRSPEILDRLCGFAASELRYYGFAEGEVCGGAALVSRTGYTGEDGFEIYLAPDRAEEVWEAVLEAGAADGLLPAGLGARDTLRLEAGMALYGHELDDETTPLEAGLGWVVKLDKGDFVGRGVLARQKAAGDYRRLVGFEIRGRGIARHGHAVLAGDAVVGEVTSGSWSPTFEKAIGMAYLPAELAAAGTEVSIEAHRRRLEAVIVDLPFYRRKA